VNEEVPDGLQGYPVGVRFRHSYLSDLMNRLPKY
jgi:hypothetical protein